MEQFVNVIKTLEEGVQLPKGDFINTILHCLSKFNWEEDVLKELKIKLGGDDATIKQLIEKLLDVALLEFYEDEVPPSLTRYHRQLLLFDSINPSVQFENNYLAQKRLQETHVLILGIGGIGNFVATSLVAAGIGKITLVDSDDVEVTNLNRQILFSENNIGESKVHAAANRLKELNLQCKINLLQKEIHSQNEFEVMLNECNKVDYIVLSADKPIDLVLWASALCKQYQFKYLKCGYMAYQGLIGPLLGYNTKTYEEIFQSWAKDIHSQNELIKIQNNKHMAPSMAASNAIFANIATWEMIKDITGICKSVLTEQRILFNLKTMDMVYG